MAYCRNCKIRAVYINDLCYECNERIGSRKSLPHGTMSYHKYNPEMSVKPKININPEPSKTSIPIEKKKKKRKKKSVKEDNNKKK